MDERRAERVGGKQMSDVFPMFIDCPVCKESKIVDVEVISTRKSDTYHASTRCDTCHLSFSYNFNSLGELREGFQNFCNGEIEKELKRLKQKELDLQKREIAKSREKECEELLNNLLNSHSFNCDYAPNKKTSISLLNYDACYDLGYGYTCKFVCKCKNKNCKLITDTGYEPCSSTFEVNFSNNNWQSAINWTYINTQLNQNVRVLKEINAQKQEKEKLKSIRLETYAIRDKWKEEKTQENDGILLNKCPICGQNPRQYFFINNKCTSGFVQICCNTNYYHHRYKEHGVDLATERYSFVVGDKKSIVESLNNAYNGWNNKLSKHSVEDKAQ